jgi:hypothetical protein
LQSVMQNFRQQLSSKSKIWLVNCKYYARYSFKLFTLFIVLSLTLVYAKLSSSHCENTSNRNVCMIVMYRSAIHSTWICIDSFCDSINRQAAWRETLHTLGEWNISEICWWLGTHHTKATCDKV